MKKISLFDFDGTLTRHDSFTGFIRHVRGWHGLAWVLLRSSWAIILWKTGFRSAVSAKLKMFSAAFAGMAHSEFKRRGEEYAAKVDRMLRKSTYDDLCAAVKRGDTVAIVSASLGDWIRPWAQRNGVQRVIATEPEVDADGRLTGGFSTPNCSHDEKVRRLLETFPDLERNRDEYHITAYGDSQGDHCMLQFADQGHLLKPASKGPASKGPASREDRRPRLSTKDKH